jgi:hypothetical protein
MYVYKSGIFPNEKNTGIRQSLGQSLGKQRVGHQTGIKFLTFEKVSSTQHFLKLNYAS